MIMVSPNYALAEQNDMILNKAWPRIYTTVEPLAQQIYIFGVH